MQHPQVSAVSSSTPDYAAMAAALQAEIMALPDAVVPYPEQMVDNSARRQSITLPFEKYLAWRNTMYVPHDNQRDHDTRVAAGKLNHVIKKFELPHATVTLTCFQGKYACADANGRSLLWSNPTKMARPKMVTVDIYYCESEDEELGVYRCIDSSTSRKTVGDDLFGLMRKHGVLDALHPDCKRLRSGAFKGALKFLNTRDGRLEADFEGAIAAYGSQLGTLSHLAKVNNRARFPNALVAAGLVLYKQGKTHATSYLEALYETLNGTVEADAQIAAMFSAVAQDKFDMAADEAQEPGCLRGRLGGETPISLLTPDLLSHYEEYAVRRTRPRVAKSRARKVA